MSAGPARAAERAAEPLMAPLGTSEPRLRVLHVLATLLPGGTEISVLRLVSAMNFARYHLGVAWLRGEAALEEDFRAAGIEAVPMGMRGKFDPACLGRLSRHVARGRFDIVHTHMDVADFYGALAGRLGGARCVVASKHAPDEFRTRRTWKRYPFLFMERLAYAMEDAVIVVSEAQAAFLESAERLPRSKMIVIGHGIDAGFAPVSRSLERRVPGLPSFDPLLGAVGRLSSEKGHSILLKALPGIFAAFPHAGLVLAGDGPARADLEEESRRLGIAERVAFLGFRRDVPALLGALDLFVQPSMYEGFGISLLEAMAAGLPIVASRVGGIPEMVEDEATGLLVAPENPMALAAAIERLLRDRDEARRLGEAAARRVRERYSLQATAAKVDALYRRILEGKR